MKPDEHPPGPAPKKKRAVSRKCPVCGSEAWRIAYGMIMPSAREAMPDNTEFAGCCIDMEIREDPATGKTEIGTPEWACQSQECRHRWW